ncbi:hypothetical protein EGW08_022950 [Elysia chlorotica]|uniref:Uncharacterized protein n=1 Tax=Elysia chlorotica TaxID=188477 RepID=A0A433SJP6_ELYCH|nr:hypothetical protein EGW08_022950 [Elysia chlorotica]
MDGDKPDSEIPTESETAVKNAEGTENTEQLNSTSDSTRGSLKEEGCEENGEEDTSDDDDSDEKNVEIDNDNVDDAKRGLSKYNGKKELPKNNRKEKKKASKKKATVVHPFLERAGRKLGNIKKKMALLKQNLKEIQNKKALRQAQKDGSELESAVKPLDNEEPSKGLPKKDKAALIRKQPAFIKIAQEESDLAPGSFKRGKRYIDVDNAQSPSSTASKRKRSMAEEQAVSDQGTDSLTSPVSTSKKSQSSIDTTVSTSSGSMIVSEKGETQTLVDTATTVRSTRSQKATPHASNKKVTPKPSSSQKKKKQRENDRDSTPRVKGLEKRRLQRQEIQAMNKKKDFYKDKDIKNRRQQR